jgi:hypothetical protein
VSGPVPNCVSPLTAHRPSCRHGIPAALPLLPRTHSSCFTTLALTRLPLQTGSALSNRKPVGIVDGPAARATPHARTPTDDVTAGPVPESGLQSLISGTEVVPRAAHNNCPD